MWKFKELQDGLPASGYTSKDVFNEYEIMLNEGIQNSVDAQADDNKPVHIKISLYQTHKKELENFLFSTDSEKQHFKESNLPHLKSRESKITLFKFEDYNTTGITGKIDEVADNMHAFLQKEGITSYEKKLGKSGGSRGIGKSSFIYTSEYQTFFLSTISKDGEMHIGRAYLKPERKVNGKYYYKDSYFVNSDENPKIHGMQGKKLENFKNIFDMHRKKNGTSIIILSPKYQQVKTDITYIQTTLQAIVQKYYFLFIEKKLIVSVSSSQNKTYKINYEKIYTYMKKYGEFSDDFIRFVKSMYTNPQDIQEIIFDLPDSTIKKSLDGIRDGEKQNFLTTYNQGNIFKATFVYDVKNKEKITFFIQKSETNVTETHLRRHILHIGKSAEQIRNRSGRKMYIGVDILAQSPTKQTEQWLKECETENHNQWIKADDTEIDNVRLGITKHIPEFLRNLVQDKENQKSEKLYIFSDVFIAKKGTGVVKGGLDNNNGDTPGGEKIDIEKTEQKFNITAIKGGFAVTGNNQEIQSPLIIRIGYLQERKSTEQCIKDYKHYDFNVADMETTIQGVDITYQQDNEIHLDNIQDNFKFSITGDFIPYFDLAIDVKEGYFNDESPKPSKPTKQVGIRKDDTKTLSDVKTEQQQKTSKRMLNIAQTIWKRKR